MGFVYGLCLLVLGCLAVPQLVVSKVAEAKKILDKLTPFQGWFGLGFGFLGLYEVVWMLSSLGLLKNGVKGIFHFAIIAVAVVCQIVLGFILSIGILRTFIKDAEAQGKMEQLFDKVLPYQLMLGALAIADGMALVVTTLMPSLLE
jgi:hypothetical protein